MKKQLLILNIFFIVSIVIFLAAVPLRADIPAEERAALIAFYNATGGDTSWYTNGGWKDGTLENDGFGPIGSESSWHGVVITDGHVTGLLLALNGVSSGIPPEIKNLTHLETLDLSINRLDGTIPPELGEMTTLKTLLLSNNQLQDEIPAELGNLVNLETLTLHANPLWGTLPETLGNLIRLQYFSVKSTRLAGRLPSSLTGLTALATLELSYNGFYTSDDTLRSFLDGVSPGWESTQTVPPANVSATPASSLSITVSWAPIAYTDGHGGYNVYYSDVSGGPWIYLDIAYDKTATSLEIKNLESGRAYYFAVTTYTSANDYNANSVTSVFSEETAAAIGTSAPFGEFETPDIGILHSGSIPVSGWALDDLGIHHVKIYLREAGELSYIGDAIQVPGARPDVELVHPGYPDSGRAGWGYMLLTHFLPDGGNGTYTLHAVATDVEGYETTLGTRTFACDNADAVVPFGAIDTPRQGETISGSIYYNQGWALTPLPNTIPDLGTSVMVYVDGAYTTWAAYDYYRPDVAEAFPGYNNTDRAGGLAFLDTTEMTDGVHTISWLVTDDAGNAEGIGSRYFTVQNAGSARRSGIRGKGSGVRKNVEISNLPVDDVSGVGVVKGFKKDAVPSRYFPGSDGAVRIESNVLERLVIHLSGNGETAPLTPLPVGSTLDEERGVFYWQPGPGFLGEYHLVFACQAPGGGRVRRDVTVIIR